MPSFVRVRLEPSGRILEVPRKSNLLRILQEAQIPVGSSCGGKGICASCKIIILNGADNLSTPNDIELDLKERNGLSEHDRISCQSQIYGDITITTNYW